MEQQCINRRETLHPGPGRLVVVLFFFCVVLSFLVFCIGLFSSPLPLSSPRSAAKYSVASLLVVQDFEGIENNVYLQCVFRSQLLF